VYLAPGLTQSSSSSSSESTSQRTNSLPQSSSSSAATTLFCVSQLVGGTCSNGTTLSSSTTVSSAVPGLLLRASLNSTTINAGGSIQLNASLFNTLPTQNNVSTASNWPLTNLTMTPCGPTDSPIAYAVISGHYTLSNISSAPRIPYFGCTTVMGGVTMYSFQPQGDVAAVIGACGSPCFTKSIGWSRSLYGVITSSYNGTEPFRDGTYTVVVADEWGDFLVSSFAVESRPSPTYVIRIWLSQSSISEGQSVDVYGNFTNTSPDNQSIEINIAGPTLYPTVYYQNGTVAWSWTQNEPPQSNWDVTVAAGQTISLYGHWRCC
jgi:hypothetical protein